MDVHRCRFVPYPGSAINALAFSASTDEELAKKGGYANLKLAVGRENGDIEIWSPLKGVWTQETIFRGGRGRSVEGLAWTQESDTDHEGKVIPGQLRLYSIGYSSTVTEWDLATGLPIARRPGGNHSEVWCLTAQPRWGNKHFKSKDSKPRDGEWKGQNLVAGCADGTLVLLSTADNDLLFSKFITRPTGQKARALSVSYKDRDIVVAGFANSCFRVFDTRTSAIIRTVSLGAAPKGGPRNLLVWTVKCLPNGDIVTGDSAGEVRFFDGQQYSQTQRMKGHDADVLDIGCNADGSKVFTAGMDCKTVLFTRPKKGRWTKVSHKRTHEHDIKALASFEGDHLSVLASGGVDTNLTVQPIRDYWEAHPHIMSTLPQLPQTASAPSARLILSYWNQEISLHRMKRQSAKAVDEKGGSLVARIGLHGDENITSATISPTGNFIIAATAAEVRFFQLSRRTNDADGSLKIRKIEVDEPVDSVRQLHLSPDGKWLALITHTNNVELLRLVVDDEKARVRVIPKRVPLNRITRTRAEDDRRHKVTGLRAYSRTVSRIQFSPDSKVLVAGDLSGHIDSWILEGHEDLTAPEVDESVRSDDSDDEDDKDNEDETIVILGQHWTSNPSTHLLPQLSSAPILLTFRPPTPSVKPKSEPNGNPAVHPTRHNRHPIAHDTPQGLYHLIVLTAQHQLYEFDLLQGKLTEWSKINDSRNLPEKFTQIKDRAMGCEWHTKGESTRLWLYGSTWLFMFDLSQNFPERPQEDEGSKRKRDDDNRGVNKRQKAMPVGLAPQTKKVVNGHIVKQEKENHALPYLNGTSGENDEEGDSGDEDFDLGGRLRGRELAVQQTKRSKNDPLLWWHTRIYRSILGMVTLGSRPECLETVIIERPIQDLALPPRYMAAHERPKN
ncbi:WD40 repeat-like protein [Tothia fuscella]|uniref:WD40 repeat-like protein n=1 Tax=Tothia fuscella TaxID=1048955 RepID=A0A9P4P4A7_9PEZI|nr:WD40 repeat-like protein [Tothia fuscella]